MKTFDIDKMRAACELASKTLSAVEKVIVPGITTDDINCFVHNFTIKNGGYPAPLNYKGFPKSCCVSPNDVVCHGIPGGRVLSRGNIVNVDVTPIVDGHFGDASATFFVGEPSKEFRRLVEVTKLAVDSAIEIVKPGEPLNSIGKTVQSIADHAGYSIVRVFGGHGIGTRFHTEPFISHYDTRNDDEKMKEGMIFTIEPILCEGSPKTWLDSDGWTVRTVDHRASAQFESTVLVTRDGCEVLTRAK